METLLITGKLLGFVLLGIGANRCIYAGFKYSIPWFIAWFIVHSITLIGMIFMRKNIIG